MTEQGSPITHLQGEKPLGAVVICDVQYVDASAHIMIGKAKIMTEKRTPGHRAVDEQCIPSRYQFVWQLVDPIKLCTIGGLGHDQAFVEFASPGSRAISRISMAVDGKPPISVMKNSK